MHCQPDPNWEGEITACIFRMEKFGAGGVHLGVTRELHMRYFLFFSDLFVCFLSDFPPVTFKRHL